MLNVGGGVDSWCGKCKLILAHTIEAMAGDKPARVHCDTCKARHSYSPDEPGEKARKPAKARASRYQLLLRGKDMTLAKRYSPKDNYAPGDLVEHPSFGVGVAIVLRDATKIEVLFDDGSKVLIQGR